MVHLAIQSTAFINGFMLLRNILTIQTLVHITWIWIYQARAAAISKYRQIFGEMIAFAYLPPAARRRFAAGRLIVDNRRRLWHDMKDE